MRENKFVLIAGVSLLAIILLFKDSIENGVQAVNGDEKFEKWDHLFKKYGKYYSVPWKWLKAICIIESSNGQDKRVLKGIENPQDTENSKSTDGKSWGLMQVTLSTARGLQGSNISAVDLNNPDTSVMLAAKLLKELIATFGIDDRQSVIRAYNGGPKFGSMTLPYYAKFVAAITLVNEYYDGEETEY